MAAEDSNTSGDTAFYEDQNMPSQEFGGDAVFVEGRSYAQAGVSDDSMSQATEPTKPSKNVLDN